MDSLDPKEKLKAYLARQDYAGATALLHELVATSQDLTERHEYECQLIHLYVNQSCYREAFVLASSLMSASGGPSLSKTSALGLAFIASFLYTLGAERWAFWLLSRHAKCKRRGPKSQKVANAILWGIYWQDLRAALSYNLDCVGLALDERTRDREVAFLFYSLTLLRYTAIGLKGLSKVIRTVERRGDRELLRDLLVWHGVALQWSSRQAEAVALQERFERDFPDTNPFLLLISYASRLHGAIAEVGPLAAAIETDRCFKISASLRESRNHIQIYAAKSALLFLEGRGGEADIFLEKARAVAERNANTLDHLIFWRLAAIAALVGGRLDQAANALAKAETYLHQYGSPVWYRQECAILAALIRVRRNPGFISRSQALILFAIRVAPFTTPARARRVLHVGLRMMTEKHPSFWAASDCLSYLQHQTTERAEGKATEALENLVIHMTQEAARTFHHTSRETKPNDDSLSGLQRRLERAFPACRAVAAASLEQLLQNLETGDELASFGILPSTSADTLHLPCKNGRLLVAVKVGNDASGSDGIVGIIAPHLDVVSADLVEAGLRMFIADHVRDSLIQKQREQEVTTQRDRAVTQTVQMLAHDVRKPFSLLRISLDRLTDIGDDPGKARDLVGKIREHVGKAVEQVEGLISDVLEASSAGSTPRLEVRSLETLLISALTQSFRSGQTSNVIFDYDLRHQHSLHVDPLKAQRLFANIFENARHAFNGKPGRICVSSEDVVQNGTIEITIMNNGPLIAEADLSRLFDAFYTSGKKGGTGLGLAICKKIAIDHGGTIRCESSMDLGVRFIFTLPAIDRVLAESNLDLPQNSSDVRAAFERSLNVRSAAVTARQQDETQRRQALTAAVERLARPLEVLVIDDEEVYLDWIRSEIQAIPEIFGHFHLTAVTTAEAAFEACDHQSFDLVISDVDLGLEQISGYDVARTVRRLTPAATICVHSNRSLPADYRDAVSAGADSFLPKPMSRVHLVGLLEKASAPGRTALELRP